MESEFFWLQISDEAHYVFTGMQSIQEGLFPHLQNKSVLRNKHIYNNTVTTKLHFEAKDFWISTFPPIFTACPLLCLLYRRMRRTVRRNFRKRPVCCSLNCTWTTVDPPLAQTLFDRNVCSVVVSSKELLSNSAGSPGWSSRITWRSDVEVCYPKVETGTLVSKELSRASHCHICSLIPTIPF